MNKDRQMSVQISTKAVVTVAEMARMVGLSRARFYQLVAAGTFPQPLYDVITRRPHYVEDQQQVCLEVRRRNCGVDLKPVIFYARRVDVPARRASISASASIPKPRAMKPKEDPLVESIKALGLTSATTAVVQKAVAELFPQGVKGVDQGEVIRAVFLKLKRQNAGDNVGR